MIEGQQEQLAFYRERLQRWIDREFPGVTITFDELEPLATDQAGADEFADHIGRLFGIPDAPVIVDGQSPERAST